MSNLELDATVGSGCQALFTCTDNDNVMYIFNLMAISSNYDAKRQVITSVSAMFQVANKVIILHITQAKSKQMHTVKQHSTTAIKHELEVHFQCKTKPTKLQDFCRSILSFPTYQCLGAIMSYTPARSPQL